MKKAISVQKSQNDPIAKQSLESSSSHVPSDSLPLSSQTEQISTKEAMESLHTFFSKASSEQPSQTQGGIKILNPETHTTHNIPTLTNTETPSTAGRTGFGAALNSPFSYERQAAAGDINMPLENNGRFVHATSYAIAYLRDVVKVLGDYVMLNSIADPIISKFNSITDELSKRFFYYGKKAYLEGELVYGIRRSRHAPLRKYGLTNQSTLSAISSNSFPPMPNTVTPQVSSIGNTLPGAAPVSSTSPINASNTPISDPLHTHPIMFKSPAEWSVQQDLYDQLGNLKKNGIFLTMKTLKDSLSGGFRSDPLLPENENEKNQDLQDIEDQHEQEQKEKEAQALELIQNRQQDQILTRARSLIIGWFEKYSPSFKFASKVAGTNMSNSTQLYIRLNLPNDMYKFWVVQRNERSIHITDVEKEENKMFAYLTEQNIDKFMDLFADKVNAYIKLDKNMVFDKTLGAFPFEYILSFTLEAAVRQTWMILSFILIEIYERNPGAPGFKTYYDYIDRNSFNIPDIRLVFLPKNPHVNIYNEFVLLVSDILNKNQQQLPNQDFSKAKAFSTLREFEATRKMLGKKLYLMGFHDNGNHQISRRF